MLFAESVGFSVALEAPEIVYRFHFLQVPHKIATGTAADFAALLTKPRVNQYKSF
jgi:hypothetical protein